jgi:hypothetical protein
VRAAPATLVTRRVHGILQAPYLALETVPQLTDSETLWHQHCATSASNITYLHARPCSRRRRNARTHARTRSRAALNGIVLSLHRGGAGAFESLLATPPLASLMTAEDPKVRERAAALCAEALTRLPRLPLPPASVAHL